MLDFFTLPYHVLGELITSLLSIVLLINILTTFSPYEFRHRVFLYASISTFLAAFVNIFSVICIGHYKELPLYLCTAVSTLYFIFLLLTPYFLCCYVIDMALTFSSRKKLGISINGFIYIFYVIIILLNVKTGWVFRYDPVEGYIRGSLKSITYITTGIYSIVGIIITIFNRKSLATRLFIVFVTYPFLSLFILAIQFIFPTIIMTGVSSYAALLLAYVSIQSDMLEFDMVTGLMTSNKFAKILEHKNKEGILYVLSIENMNIIQNNLGLLNVNKLLLDIAKEFSKYFQRNSYHLTTSRFVGIASDIEEIKAAHEKIKKYLDTLTIYTDLRIPVLIDAHYIAVGLTEGNKSINSVMEVVNNLLKRAVINQNHELLVCDTSVLASLERKRIIGEILKRELRLDSQQFQVWFQPIYSTSEKRFVYMEALSRLNGTEIGDISPQEFVEVAESTGLIEKLGFVAFEKACKFIADNKDVIPAVSINFSVYQMSNPNVVTNVLSTIERFGLKPSNIIMEITESLFIDNYEQVCRHVTELSNYGVQFYLDDFGTGYSNLANVIGLPFSTIKIDRTLVLMMEQDKVKEQFFMNMVATLRDAGKKILVEGVETVNQNHLVEKAGADYIQGFLYSRPVPSHKCLELFNKQ